ncbi:hypothetical protein MKX03_027354 [Papaver bracteatum]|nr:hypothetical protein MKX03_027354 [Papaver bracteatum]
MSTDGDGDEHTHESEETKQQRIETSNLAGIELMLSKLVDSLAQTQQQMLETRAQNKQLLESLTTCFSKGLETQAQNQQHLLESLTRCVSKGLEEVVKNQNKALANQTGEKKVKADDGKKQKTAEKAAVPCVVEEYGDLFWAAVLGDWNCAKEFFEAHPDATTKPITSESQTTLHIAIRCGEWKFVEDMVNFGGQEVLEMKEKSGLTALHIAASLGNIKAAQLMVEKNSKLVMLRDNEGNIPLETAISKVSDGQNKTVEYLYIVTLKNYRSLFSGPQGAKLLCSSIEAGFFDVAISIVKRFPVFAMEKLEKTEMYVLESIICRPFSFFSGTKLSWWERLVYSLIPVDMGSPYDELDWEEDKENHPAENKESIEFYRHSMRLKERLICNHCVNNSGEELYYL